jgi:hypothetical protein
MKTRYWKESIFWKRFLVSSHVYSRDSIFLSWIFAPWALRGNTRALPLNILKKVLWKPPACRSVCKPIYDSNWTIHSVLFIFVIYKYRRGIKQCEYKPNTLQVRVLYIKDETRKGGSEKLPWYFFWNISNMGTAYCLKCITSQIESRRSVEKSGFSSSWCFLSKWNDI